MAGTHLSVILFFLAGLALIPFPGLQNDELFFSGPLYFDDAAIYRIQIGATKIPFMVMSYTGALKTWLYAGLFQFLAPTEWSVRIPVLLMGMATIWLTWVWTRRLAGVRAAAVVSILLATDTIFQLTNTFDWGPVALQHILLMAGLLAVQSWLDRGDRRMLALGFFFWGLGMWDKALLSWPLIGLAVAALCVYPRETFRRLRPVPLAIAVLSFLIGAAPLVWYNIDRRGETASANTKFTTEGFGAKVTALRQTVTAACSSATLFIRTQRPAAVRRTKWSAVPPPQSPAFWRSQNKLNASGMDFGLVCFVILVRSPHWRLMCFLLIATAVAWAQMAFNRGTGGAAHHVILLWPFPVIFIGIAFTEAAARIPRFGTVALTALVALLRR